MIQRPITSYHSGWRKAKDRIFFWLGYPGLVAGALFLAPTFVRVTEWTGAWITGFLLHVPHSFLKMQLSRNLSRSV